MARSRNLLLRNVQGQIGKEFVVKKYGKKTVVTKYPDMSGIKPSKLQKVKRSRFAEAVAFAQSIIRDPSKKAIYAKKVKKGQSVYHYAIKEFLKNN